MKLQTKILLIVTIMITSFSFSQDVKVKNDKIYVEGEHLLNYEKINISTHSFFDKNDDEILFFKVNYNETPQYSDDDFYTLNFINEKVKVEISDFNRIAAFMSSKKMVQKLIKWLVKDKVITKEGAIDVDRLTIFFDKYDEEITERTIRN